jgi:hypothetical protein
MFGSNLKRGLKLDALLMCLEVIRSHLVDLVER